MVKAMSLCVKQGENWIKTTMKLIVKVTPDLCQPMPDPSCAPLPPSKTMSATWTQCVTVFGNAPLTVGQAHWWFGITIAQLAWTRWRPLWEGWARNVLCPKHTATILFVLLGWLSFASFVSARNKLCPCPATNLCRRWLCMSASQTRTKCSWVVPSQLYWLVYPLPTNQHSRFFSSHFLQPWPRPMQLRQHLWQAAQQSLTLQMWSNRLPSPPPCPRP